MAEKPEVYKSQPIRTTLLRIVLGIEITACLITFTATAFFISIILYPIPARIYWTFARSLAVLPTLATLCFLVWLYRANANARALSATPLETTPRWAIGWFFLPVAALIKPWAVVTEVYQTSRKPLGGKERGGSLLVTAWWILRLLGDLAGLSTLTTRLAAQATTNNGTVLFCAITLIHQILLLIIVARVDRWQTAADRTINAF